MKQLTKFIIVIAIFIIALNGKQLIGGCGGVHPDHTQECCQNWAEENDIAKPFCVGEWEIENNECRWVCRTQSCCGC